jgi:ferredoxin-NADP reductase
MMAQAFGPVRRFSMNRSTAPHGRKEVMDKLVRRVTLVERSGQTREAKVVYESDEEDDDDRSSPHLRNLERSVRHMLKAQVIGAQEAYERHLKSAGKGGRHWLTEGPGNLMKARRKAMKEMQHAAPFKIEKNPEYDEED